VNATIPKDTEINGVTLQTALGWLQEKAARGGGKTARRGAARKTASTTTKKAAKAPKATKTATPKARRKKAT
jgi:DNA topoisomerase-1